MATKICTRKYCRKELPIEEFIGPRGKECLQCSSCRSLVRRGMATRRAKMPDLVRQKNREWNSKKKTDDPRYWRNRNLFRSYGITIDDYEKTFNAQSGLCAICGAKPESLYALVVDHNHETGKVRGLLCSGCNIGIGCLKDSPSALRSAALYLEAAAVG